MPIYEYRCSDCSTDFELLVRSSTKVECPHCHSASLEKKLSVFAPAVSNSAPACSAAMPACGTCGHPDGPGACALQ